MCKGEDHPKAWTVARNLLADLRYVLHDFTSKMALNTAKHASLSDIHDRCIVATTASLLEMGHDAVLVTRDQSIANQGLCPLCGNSDRFAGFDTQSAAHRLPRLQ
jgi:hypothetical protein